MAKANTTVMAAPAVPMTGIWRTIRDYIFWSYERGTIQYDVMVTIILLFVFLSPRLINFKDKPVEHNPHRTGVAVVPDGQGGLIYQIEAAAVNQAVGNDDSVIRGELLQIIEPISGEVSITKVEPVRDGSGHILSYKVWVARE
ncbi:MAG TPA: hypothetical protein VK788_01155 [Terriglobales bacterium]|jgi:hypothetical protein|nr:hypothetical protein [Terriglobales bacterium]